AALVDAASSGECVVIRGEDESAIDHALLSHGMPTQGVHRSSPWRAALQVLPLALELAFDPKDPGRVYELLGLAGGPFAGAVARRLMYALARAPGVGGRPWEEARQRLSASHAEDLERVTEWFE